MTDVRRETDGDGKLRKFLASVPRIGAPTGFELRVRRKIASGTAGETAGRRRLTTVAIPALSLVVVAGVAVIIYLAPFGETDRGPVVPGSPGGRSAPATVPQNPALQDEDAGGVSPGRTARKDESGKSKGAPEETREAAQTKDLRSAPRQNSPRLMKSRPEPAAVAVPSEARPAAAPSMVPPETLVTDSLAPGDTLGRDSAKIRPDSTSVPPDTAATPADPVGNGSDRPR